MAVSDVSLTSGSRKSLLNIQDTSKLVNRTQDRLATGKKVTSSVDDPVLFAAAQQLLQQAGDLLATKDGMSEGINTVNTANNSITAMNDMLNQAKSIADNALVAGDTAVRASYAKQYDTVMDQITSLAKDAGYKGTNLLSGDTTLSIKFDATGSSSLNIKGFEARDLGSLGLSYAGNNWTTTDNTAINNSLKSVDSATTNLRTESKSLTENLNIITSREDCTTGVINNFKSGADNLTLADMNEESANMLMLQTRQNLSVTQLGMASHTAQSVLKLFS